MIATGPWCTRALAAAAGGVRSVDWRRRVSTGVAGGQHWGSRR